ncbi:hypothetical protein HF329_09960 [Chitinophaga oryzae]|uniref:Uncharacterized protein n=1 Tax=Chitinophaga oryzae TaxID=2725414 RepID=A0AAE6ZFB0_9BACT|nr:hypothetical protein [Chitinophaga oryzae]QJB31616.1 hypothetical protein HF329_09960 [Chitinophaga oryzae]
MKFPLYLLCLTFLSLFTACAQQQPAAPYKFDIPSGWTTETFPIPIDFAPTIPYKGKEELRFTPGWGAPGEQHWSYAFVWWLEGMPEISEATLQRDLEAYYGGLVGRNITKRNIPADKVVPTKVAIRKVTTASGYAATYSGTVDMLDYMALEPITLNCVVHLFRCKKDNHTGIYFEVSPKKSNDPLWQQFEKLLSVQCK